MIPETLTDLLKRETRAFAYLALTLADGAPQVSPLWFDWDGQHIILNTARGRVKDKAMQRRALVALCIADPQDPYRYLLIRGRVTEETEAGAFEQICDLREKYLGDRDFPRRPWE